MRALGVTLLHALLWMAAAALTAHSYALGTGVAGACAGALLGVLAGGPIARSPLRSRILPFLALAVSMAAVTLAALATRWPGPAQLLGPRALFAAAELIPALLVPLSLVAALEALAQRHALWRLAGLALLAALYARLFAAHREGFLNRPFALVDQLWGRGLDPLPWFLFLGLGLVGLLTVLLVRPGGARRTFAGLGLLLLALLAVFLALPLGQLKQINELHRVQGEGKEGPGTPEPEPGRPEPGRPDPTGQEGKEGFQDQSSGAGDPPVAVVVFHHDYTPPLGAYYFRETVFSAFNGARLVQDGGGRFDRDLPAMGATLPASPGGREIRTTVAVMALHGKPFGLVNPVSFQETGNPDPKRFFQAYSVRSRAVTALPKDLLRAPLGGAAWDAATLTHYTEGPADPRYQALAEQIIQDLRPEYRELPFARALAIKLWLDRNTTYSLATSHGDSPDPVADFLFGDLRGHCVYLAHAACLLYRAAGIPARVAGGYAAEPGFRYGGASLLLRARNAHSWPEVHLRDLGWTPLDITPAKSEVSAQEAPDHGLQQMLGEMAMGERPPPPPPEDQATPLRERLLWLGRLLAGLLLGLALLTLPACYAVKLWRRWRPRFCPPAQTLRLAYRAALDTASALGHRRARGEPREAFAARLAPLSPAFARLSALHLRQALGHPGAPAPAALCLDLLRASRAELASAATPARRRLAALHPLAWARVH